MNVLYQGKLNNNEAFFVQELSINNLKEILSLQELVYDALENKEILQQLTKEEFLYILKGNGIILGAFVNQTLIGVRSLLIPSIDENHLGLHVGIREDELDKVIYQEISFIHPSYRGNKLQQLLAKLIMNTLKQRDSSYRYVCSTVAPSNIPSLKDKFNQRMEVWALKEIYGGKLRYIFLKDLVQTSTSVWEETKDLALDNFSLQEQLLKDGWVGYKLVKRGKDFYIRFGKRVQE